ncbi:MAG: hypothetical protein HZA16_00060 [Nitrospirae bacterium]|nr:hypothetical protein [Nitrospirota bacterium]
MTELEKLRHLLEHWMEHNSAHVKTYEEWAEKAGSLGEKEIAGLLRLAADETRKLDGLFRKAKEIL